jgi:hypothetical protein
MRLERIANGAPRVVIHIEAVTRPQFQFKETFVFSDSARDCNELSVTNRTVVGKALREAFQTTVSAQPIRKNKIVNITILKPGRAPIPTKDL